MQKLSHIEYRDRIVKYLLGEVLKNNKISLQPILSKRIGKHHVVEHEKTCLYERHLSSCIPKGEGIKWERPSGCCFVCSHIPGHLFKKKRTSYWCIGVKIVENHYVLSFASRFTIQKEISKNMDNWLENGSWQWRELIMGIKQNVCSQKL